MKGGKGLRVGAASSLLLWVSFLSLIVFSGDDGGGLLGGDARGGVGAGAELFVDHVEAHLALGDHLELVDDVAGVLFFFHLFVHEPDQLVGGGEVLLVGGQTAQVVDQGGHFLFVGEGLAEHVEGGGPFGGHGGDRGEGYAAAAAQDVVDEELGVGLFFLVLDGEPVGDPFIAFHGGVEGHREVEVGGPLFGVDLGVEGFLKFGA